MKVELTKIKTNIDKIIDAETSSPLQKIFAQMQFAISKKNSRSHFATYNALVLEKLLPLVIFQAMLFYPLQPNQKLSLNEQLFLKSLFEAEARLTANDFGDDTNVEIIKSIVQSFTKYQELILVQRKKISNRIILFDSKSNEHHTCLGREKIAHNIVIKFRGIQIEAVHIRAGIKVIKDGTILKFTLQDVVNKKDLN